MSGNGLLDTNIVIALFASELSVINRLKNADEVFLSSIVPGELYYGFSNQRMLNKIYRTFQILVKN